MTNKTKIPFALGVAVALALAAGGQLTGGGGLTRVVTSDSRFTGSGTTAAPLALSLSVTAPVTGTGSGGSPFGLNTAAVTGRVLGRAILTGSSSATLPTSSAFINIRCIGGGGGGAGGAANSAGSGGNSGTVIDLWTGTPGVPLSPTTYSWVSGGAGSGGNNTGTAGTNGGDTTLTMGGSTFTAKSGAGGAGPLFPGAQPSGSTSTGLVTFGPGGQAVVIAGTLVESGEGGATSMGPGGILTTGTTGQAPSNGLGGGGSGGRAGDVGGAGAAGGCDITFYN